ncbi:MAG: hypothetical protein WCF77_00110 [Minisyncoccia bacterium]
METFFKVVGAFVFLVGILVIVGLLMGYPVMWLMNYLIAPTALQAVFGISQMTFWKAFWLNVLCGLLFKTTVKTSKDS